ncbi:MAG: hypothetical protein AAFZ52_10350 [Bacteroidota bacterium]
MLRYFILFGGIVLMITGCNSLISQQFGTHRLRTLPIVEVQEQGVGDADFIEVVGTRYGAAYVLDSALLTGEKHNIFRPLLTEGQHKRWAAGETLVVNLIGWYETTDPTCLEAPACPPDAARPVRGLVDEPSARRNPVADWAEQRITLSDNVTYLKLNEKPLAWYWNLALFLGGLLLAILPEARRHARQRRDESSTN